MINCWMIVKMFCTSQYNTRPLGKSLNMNPNMSGMMRKMRRCIGSPVDGVMYVWMNIVMVMRIGSTYVGSLSERSWIQSMNGAFRNLGIGLLFAAVFVYLLMVVNYQNFGDPFVVILALPFMIDIMSGFTNEVMQRIAGIGTAG